jgi:hypothetical protein
MDSSLPPKKQVTMTMRCRDRREPEVYNGELTQKRATMAGGVPL